MLEGIITKGIGGFYYIQTLQGMYECRARGIFRKNNITPLVGDKVIIQIDDEVEKKGTVNEILPRKNEIYRPKAANIDQIICTFSPVDPRVNFYILDQFAIIAESKHIKTIICINKMDLADELFYQEVIDIYKHTGYLLLQTSAASHEGIEPLRQALELEGAVSVFAGPSGTGKSSLINAVTSRQLKTGEISSKLKRGKHTTREAVLLSLNGKGFVVDTPGFTSMSLEGIEKEDLEQYFVEFNSHRRHCKYTGCSHVFEKECAVKEQIGIGIHQSRYQSYVRMYQELEKNK